MQFRRVGSSGLVVSAIGFGCNNLGRPNSITEDLKESERVVQHAIDSGITFFDTADIYGKTPGLSETYLGKALTKHRDSVVIGTKFGMDMNGRNGVDHGARGSRKYILKAVEQSLRRLKTDYIDLFQFHTPDVNTPIDETIAALDQLISEGKIRYIGHSNFSGWQIAEAEYIAKNLGKQRFISAQNHYNLMDRRAELEVIPASYHFELGFFPYFPLNNGMLTGKYSSKIAPKGSRLSYVRQYMLDEANWDQLVKFDKFAKERDLTPAQAAIGWLSAQRPVSSVIAGSTTVTQISENVGALSYKFVDEDFRLLDEIFPPAAPIALY